jgi:hypothetical protein
MREPIHRVQADESGFVPWAPRQRGFCLAAGRCRSQRPTADDDKQADGMETATRDCVPDDLRGGLDRRCQAVPAVFTGHFRDEMPGHRIGSPVAIRFEKMEIDDPKDCESLGDVEPDQAFHRGAVPLYNAFPRIQTRNLAGVRLRKTGTDGDDRSPPVFAPQASTRLSRGQKTITVLSNQHAAKSGY